MPLRILLLALLLTPATFAAGANRAVTERVAVELLAEPAPADAARLWLAADFSVIPGWHLYWRNPGDSGEAPRITWSLPAGWQAGEIHWPVPKRIPVGPLTNYGYEDAVTLLVPLERAPDAASGIIAAQLDWLVCEVECIPESAQLRLPTSAWDAPGSTGLQERFGAARASLPAALALPAHFTLTDRAVRLVVALPADLPDPGDAWFASATWGPVAPNGQQRWERDREGLVLTAPTGDLPPDPAQTLPGLLVLESSGDATARVGFRLVAEPGAPPVATAAGTGLPGLAGMWLLAFVGGLLLNLMPCVLPVLSIKVLGFAATAHGGRGALAAHGLLYGVGVLACFLLLAGALLLLKAGGSAVGWGFQLQSPVVVWLLAGLMLAVGLNLSGVFQVGQRLMAAAGRADGGSGFAAPVLHGAMAVLVASPCTAPFMGTALGFALTQSAAAALSVFAALGMGFAAPVVVLSLFPAWLRRMPRPGPWMERLRQGLALPMYGAALWLVWVLAQQVSGTGLAFALGGLWLLATAAWLHGQAQRGVTGFRAAAWVTLAAALALLGPVWNAGHTATDTRFADARAWSPQRVGALQADGRPVFVNFTAAWCITCKVNEQVALERPDVKRLMHERGITYLKGDWTRRDARIAEELSRHGRSGVPLYLAFPGRPGAPPQVLPQILTEDVVIAALERL